MVNNITLKIVDGADVQVRVRSKHVKVQHYTISKLNLPLPSPIPIHQDLGSDQNAAISQEGVTRAVSWATKEF